MSARGGVQQHFADLARFGIGELEGAGRWVDLFAGEQTDDDERGRLMGEAGEFGLGVFVGQEIGEEQSDGVRHFGVFAFDDAAGWRRGREESEKIVRGGCLGWRCVH